MRLTRTLTVVAVLAATILLSGCCRCPCAWKPARWWDPCCTPNDCAPLGDPCDCCDPRG